MSVSNHPYNHHGYPWYALRSDIRNTDLHADIHADIGATDLGAQFTADIRGCTDNSTRTSVMLRVFKRISARTVRPGHQHGLFDTDTRGYKCGYPRRL